MIISRQYCYKGWTTERNYRCLCGSLSGVEYKCRCGTWFDTLEALSSHQPECSEGEDYSQCEIGPGQRDLLDGRIAGVNFTSTGIAALDSYLDSMTPYAGT